MEAQANLVESAMKAGIIQCEMETSDQGTSWPDLAPRVERFLTPVNGKTTLFLGSAGSIFKPAMLPMWDKFIELLWSSIMETGLDNLPDRQGLTEGFKDFLETATGPGNPDKIPNYMITEIIARRLGTEYLHLLDAFSAQETGQGKWAINSVHDWVANGLMEGRIAAVVTTNFDDYLERALEANSAYHYQVTGDPHIDGDEISTRLRSVPMSQNLVLVVNGSMAFSFVRSLMPQLGRGKITFLFKIHGSCYAPETCIDTRLQRSQGLPSYVTDILDTLLLRTVWLVAGFSGSDMNDNLDYLRLVSNRKHARLIWLHFANGYMEKALRSLTNTLDRRADSPHGLCLLHGFFVGEKISADDKFPLFDNKVMSWARNLGTNWCKLVLMDLVLFIEGHTDNKPDPALLRGLNEGETPRQDWNKILERMDLRDQESQVPTAKLCNEVSGLLQSVFDIETRPSEDDLTELCRALNVCLADAQILQDQMRQTAEADRPHAQTWVIPALRGLILACGGQAEAALKMFQNSSCQAWLVGDLEKHLLITKTINALFSSGPHVPEITEIEESTEIAEPFPYVAFVPSMDNVIAKMNRYGVPPAHYIRALLHRAILFADGVAVPPNILTNSTVFVSEVLFQGDRNTYNEMYLQCLFPMLPSKFRESTHKILEYRKAREASYMLEPIDEQHIHLIDEYFEMPRHKVRFIYYDEDEITRDYGEYTRRQVAPSHAGRTVDHLVSLWDHIESNGMWNLSHDYPLDRSSVALAAAQNLVDTLEIYFRHLPTRMFRSQLYRFGDLMEGASDRASVLRDLRLETTQEEKDALVKAREKIIDKPWIYGPFCHEIFDAPYKSNLVFDFASKSSGGTFVFVEDDEVRTWEFMSRIRSDSASPVRIATSAISDGNKCSSLLLSQAPEKELLQSRNELSQIRQKLARGLELSEEDKIHVKEIMKSFMESSLEVTSQEIDDLVAMEPHQRDSAEELLKNCMFLIRKGLPLQRMYQEVFLTVPGLLRLESAQATVS